jgi:hypothetical protein
MAPPPFWLSDPTQLYKLNTEAPLNVLSTVVILVGISLSLKHKKSEYIAYTILALTAISFYNTSPNIFMCKPTKSSFDPLNSNLSNAYNTTNMYLVQDTGSSSSGLQNSLYVNQASSCSKGDIIALSVNGNILETNIISDIQYTVLPGVTGSPVPVLLLVNPLKNKYKMNTVVMKVTDASPTIIPPPDANTSIQNSNSSYTSDPYSMAVENFPSYNLPNLDRYDWNLELSTYGGLQPGQPPNYKYDGQPYGPLKCRSSTLENPMATINVTEYDSEPSMYGTCNVQENNNNNIMTANQEATVSQRVDDLLFHKGNSQAQYSPVPVDTLPNDQEAFAHFCYRSPTNLVNPKYASIFVNDPEKYKLVAKLARASGSENGGGGGR